MKYWLILILTCLSGKVCAGPGTAAVLPHQDSLQTPTLFSFYQHLYNTHEQTAGHVLRHPSAQYGFSSAGMALTHGDWRTYQQAESSTVYQISSRGAYTLKNVRFSGSFDYQRRLEDSVGWMLKPDQHDTSPYYLATPKPGNWDAHTYRLKGAIGLPLLGVLHAVAGGDLAMGEYGRFTDPRPQIRRYRLKLSGGLGLLFDDWSLTVSGIHGYGDESTDVSYANAMNNTPGRPATVTHDIMGYGYYRTTGSSLKLLEDQETRGAAAVFQVRDFNLAYTLEQATRLYFRRTGSTVDDQGRAILGEVTQQHHSLSASYAWEGPAYKSFAHLGFSYLRTEDFNKAIINGNNYQGTALAISPSYHSKRDNWEYSLASNLTRETRKDGTAGVDYLVQTAAVTAEGGRLFILGKQLLKLNLGVGYRKDLGSALHIGTQYNAFMQGVVLPDFAYYSSDQLAFSSSLGLGFKVKDVVLMPVLSYDLRHQLQPAANPYATFNPGNIRATYTFGLNIHM